MKSVAVIQGEENHYDILKRHLLQFLSRKIECYVVFCKTGVHELHYEPSKHPWICIKYLCVDFNWATCVQKRNRVSKEVGSYFHHPEEDIGYST